MLKRQLTKTGGDCSITVAALDTLPGGTDDLAVVWCDAHGDLHTPDTSPSGAFSGMALRAVLGEGEPQLALSPGIPRDRVVTVGVRNLDESETDEWDRLRNLGVADLDDPAALADAIEGRELWAEGFQCGLDYMFETQEQITDQIVSSISNEVEMAEQQRALLETPANLDAWSAYHRGYWHMYRFNAADFEEARRCFELSARLDPNLSRTYACLSFVHWQQAFLEIAPDRRGEIQRALEVEPFRFLQPQRGVAELQPEMLAFGDRHPRVGAAGEGLRPAGRHSGAGRRAAGIEPWRFCG